MTLHEQADTVKTRGDFIAFVRRLSHDAANDSTWEHQTIPAYLEALAAWFDDMNGFYAKRGTPTPENSSWALMAQALLAARYYE